MHDLLSRAQFYAVRFARIGAGPLRRPADGDVHPVAVEQQPLVGKSLVAGPAAGRRLFKGRAGRHGRTALGIAVHAEKVAVVMYKQAVLSLKQCVDGADVL